MLVEAKYVWVSTDGPKVTAATTVLVADTNPTATRVPLLSKERNEEVLTDVGRLPNGGVQ